LLIMNELHEKTEGGTDMVKNFPELLPVEPRVLEHHPVAWEQARRTLFRQKLPAWYLRAARWEDPQVDEPHRHIFSHRLRRALQQRLVDLHVAMRDQELRADAHSQAVQVRDLQSQFRSTIARFTNEAAKPLDYLIWTHADLVVDATFAAAWYAETLDPFGYWKMGTRFSEERLAPLFVRVYHELMSMSLCVDLQQFTRFDLSKPEKVGDWITNQPVSIKSLWPRREGVKYFESIPKPTHVWTSEQLMLQDYVGIYLAEDVEDYLTRPLIKP